MFKELTELINPEEMTYYIGKYKINAYSIAWWGLTIGGMVLSMGSFYALILGILLLA